MLPLILLLVIATLPLIQGILFRVSAIYIFVSIVAGELLVRFVGDDAGLALGAIIKGANSTIFAQLFLLLFPLVVTIILLRHSLPKSKIILHIVPLAAVGSTLSIFAVSIFPSELQKQVLTNSVGMNIIRSQDLVIAGTCILVLGLMWLTSRHQEGKHHHKHH